MHMKEIREKTLGYILAGFGFVAGLAWNDAIKSSIDYLYPASADALFSKFLYAFTVTVVAVLIGTYAFRGLGKK